MFELILIIVLGVAVIWNQRNDYDRHLKQQISDNCYKVTSILQK